MGILSHEFVEYTTTLNVDRVLWALSIGLFGVADLASTIYFIGELGAIESHPVADVAIETLGLWILIPWKAAAIGLFYAAYRIVPNPHSLGIPIGLVLLGIVLTVWNIRIGLLLL